MERFSKVITVDNEKRLFEFTKRKDMNGSRFFITTKDAQQKPIAFSLKEAEHGTWKLMPGALRWLYEIETELSNAIREVRNA
jgi:hypothetical protein